MQVRYRVQQVGDVKMFYREAGEQDAPVILLLHGFPSAGHMFRDLIPLLAPRYRVIAPDLPGFGNTAAPDRTAFAYTFDNLAKTVGEFCYALGLKRYSIYIFDYGAPVGLRLALSRPERVEAIISQNGNAYEEGLSGAWADVRNYWQDPSPQNREALRNFFSFESTRQQYLHGADETLVSPDGYTLDDAYLSLPGIADIQLDLLLDYRTNVALYPTFQEYFRTATPPLLAVWGKHDPFFLPAGAEAYKRDIPNAEVRFFETGHFALETHAEEIGAAIDEFLRRSTPSGRR